MNEPEKMDCKACGRQIDANAHICPYCAANPSTGERDPDRPAAEEVIPKKPQTTPVERITSTIKSRSGLFFGLALVVGIALLIIVSSWVNERQVEAAANVPPVPLTEVSDLNTGADAQEEEVELPELEFEYDGNPETLNRFVTEPGEVAPEVEESSESTGSTGNTGSTGSSGSTTD